MPVSENTSKAGSLSQRRLALLAKRLEQEGLNAQQSAAIPRRANLLEYPLSSAQQRLCFLSLFEGGSHYNDHFNQRISGRLNVAVLERALGEILRRHEVMRSTFTLVDGQLVQRITPAQDVQLHRLDLQEVADPEREREAMRLAIEEARKPFDLANGPLWRFGLLALGPEDHILLITAHHICIDGWSRGVFLRELAELYEAFLAGRPSPLMELPIQYADYAAWHNQWLKSGAIVQQVEYWRQQIAGAPPLLELPSDKSRPPVQTFHGARHFLKIPKDLVVQLKGLSRGEGVTLFMTLLAAFQALLERYAPQEDIVVGSPVANRTRAETENLIGFFLNTIVLRSDLSGEPSFRELLKRVRETTLGALAHQDAPLEQLIEALQPGRDLSYSPLFQVFFVLQNTPMSAVEFGGLLIQPFEVDNGTAKFDLTLSLCETADGLTGWFEYSTDLFSAERVGCMATHFETLLNGVVANPNERLSKLPLLSAAENRRLLLEWNETHSDYSRMTCVHELFSQQAVRTPAAIAVEFQGQQLTYRQLEQRAEQLSVRLKSLGVGPDVLVAVYVRRSLDMIVGLLGVLKAGGAYLPLDLTFPAERLAFMLGDAQPKVLVTQTDLLSSLPAHTSTVLCLDASFGAPQIGPIQPSKPSNLAYVLYTSGSTGRPKGVQITHQAVVNFLSSMRRKPGVSPLDVVLALTTISFDIAGLEIWLPLTAGARVVLVSAEEAMDGSRLADVIHTAGVTLMQATPPTWRLLLESGWKGNPTLKALCGGEAWTTDLAERLLPRCASLWNMYGPTETTIWSAVSEVTRGERISIGRPIANTRLYVVDSNLEPVPVGVPGELLIGGDGVARGYLNRPELTAERFLADPFCGIPGERVYRTGDLVRLLPDGNIEHIRRIDQQVKVRGYRIELGEVETALSRNPAVREAVVIAETEPSGGNRLAAYLVCNSEMTPTAAELRRDLEKYLPEYMVPSSFLQLTHLPLTPNGKVDRKKLSLSAGSPMAADSEKVPPRDALESQLIGIWKKVLGRNSIGVRDNFFDLGGHSLSALRLFAEIKKNIGRQLPLATLFQAPTVEQLAAILRETGWTSPWHSLVPIQGGGSKPPFYCVHGGGGNVLLFRGLSRYLGTDQPFYGLQSRSVIGKGIEPTSVEELAAEYLKEIREFQPQGPYFLGGFCMGGKVAFEMARLLVSQGETVAFLALLDSYNHNGVPPYPGLGDRVSYFFQKSVFHWRNLTQLNYQERIAYFAEKLEGSRTREMERLSLFWRNLFSSTGDKGPEVFLEELNERAGFAYKPRPYPGKVVVFKPRMNFTFNCEPNMGWNDFVTGGLEIVELPAYPGAIFNEPFVRDLAHQLHLRLEQSGRL